ncbi:phenylalanine--tRNA ligase subunit alpha [Candidatus Micrarchaeota archaeon]|nr:phenylalanine--tRNA ligase subunit alpha [Candidatus Micrarchaeota archaeon]
MYKGEDKVLEILLKAGQASASGQNNISFEKLASLSKINPDSLRRIIESLKSNGYVSIQVSESVTFQPTKELLEYKDSDFPEFLVFIKALSNKPISGLTPTEKSIGIRWAKVKGLISIENGLLVPSKTEDEAEELSESLKEVAVHLEKTGTHPNKILIEELIERRLLEKKLTKTSIITYTGKHYAPSTSEFDISVPSADAPMGKNHPITKMTKKMRQIMVELGFQEMEGELVESSFWNFDALFQPQDHPARELADTCYVTGEAELPTDKALVDRVKTAHEKGWKYKWNPAEAQKRVLRTHTTALSARHVAAIKDKKPRKYFAIGKVFRNEATDYKHLAEFHQVEGIIAWENATFTDLLGILKEFYGKLGFNNIRFRPSFFPYTEPSLEIEVYYEKRKQWMELGGAGIFRPEVSIPLAGVYPVLAWGLSLERPLMLDLDLEDIRALYKNDSDFLKSVKVDL